VALELLDLRAPRLPCWMSASILLRRADRRAISLPEKKPFPSNTNRIAPTMIHAVVMGEDLF